MKRAPLLLLTCSFSLFAEELKLNTTISPPYQYIADGRLTGSSITTLQCVLNAMGKPVEIKIAPEKRALQNIRYNVSDGFFVSMQIDEVDSFAKLSAPIALEKWFLYTTKPNVLPNNLTIGAVRGSNEEQWLIKHHYPVSMLVNNSDQLVKLLSIGRIDALLADEASFRREFNRSNPSLGEIYSQFVKYTPLGVYFSQGFINRYPDFLPLFNKTISTCSSQLIHLSDQEQRVITQIVSTLYPALLTPQIITEIEKHNLKFASADITSIKELDRQWVSERGALSRPLIDESMANPVSIYLKQLAQEAGGVYAEIFVMGSRGVNVGQSHISSDYWQGDEDKFIQTFANRSDSVFIDDVKYDESSKKYLVQASQTLFHPTKKIAIGVLTVGIDIEKALLQDARFEKIGLIRE